MTESKDHGQAEPRDWTPRCHNSGSPGRKWEPAAAADAKVDQIDVPISMNDKYNILIWSYQVVCKPANFWVEFQTMLKKD